MARKTRSEKELHWREMVNRQAGSGLSVRQFLREAADLGTIILRLAKAAPGPKRQDGAAWGYPPAVGCTGWGPWIHADQRCATQRVRWK